MLDELTNSLVILRQLTAKLVGDICQMNERKFVLWTSENSSCGRQKIRQVDVTCLLGAYLLHGLANHTLNIWL